MIHLSEDDRNPEIVQAMALRLLLVAVLALPLCMATLTALQAQTEKTLVPGLWRGDVRTAKPSTRNLKLLRFSTTRGYPPFNYHDEDGTLTGFNVDLASAICDVLKVECDIQVKDWNSLLTGLQKGEADGVIASISMTRQTLQRADFTDRYYETPARFVVLNSSPLQVISPKALAGRAIAVVKGSAHEAYLKAFFDKTVPVPFKSIKLAEAALTKGEVDLLFGDAISLVFWLNGAKSAGCCRFQGEAYFDQHYFGAGIGIALQKGNREMQLILNYALEQVRANGTYEELFLRYFPLSFY